MHARLLLFLSLGLVSGCASAGQANANSDAAADADDIVEMVVRNERPTSTTVFVWWENGSRVRLGELGGGATRTFTTRYRSDGVWLSWGRGSRGDRPQEFVPVEAGDRIEWSIRSGPIPFWRRLPRG